MAITFDGFVEAEYWNAVDFCEVAVEHDAHAADRANHFVDLFDRNGRFRLVRHWRED